MYVLQILDLRHTLLGDSEISCLKSLPCLTELLMECPTNLQQESVSENMPLNRNPVVVIRPLDRPHVNNLLQPRRELQANAVRQLNEENIQVPFHIPQFHGFPNNRQANEAIWQQQIVIHINRNIEENHIQQELPQIHVIPGLNIIENQNPMGGADPGFVMRDIILGLNNGHIHMPHLPAESLITDRAICGFGNSVAINELNLIRIQGEHAAEECESLLERIVVRNYTLVTDRSLRHLANAIPHLKYLDVRGTTVTRQGVEKFKHDCPNCNIISDIEF